MKKGFLRVMLVLLAATLFIQFVLPDCYRNGLLEIIEGKFGVDAFQMRIDKKVFAEKYPEINRRAEALERQSLELLQEADVCRQAIQDQERCLDELLRKKKIYDDEVKGFERMYFDRLNRLIQEKKSPPVEIDPARIKLGRGEAIG